MKVERALVSVYDKSGLESLASALEAWGVTVYSSGGTARRLRELGYGRLVEVSSYTGFPESPGGLVKTLHPRVHGGILLNPEDPTHRDWMEANQVQHIDLVVVNLYPFEEAVQGGASLEEAAHQIDIGGPTLIRSAAKASILYNKVCVVTDPSQYGELVEELQQQGGGISTGFARRMALEAFRRTASYDQAIKGFLEARL
ncbi:MAG TPA: hypothetical protein ENF19_01550 [Candidatus Bathyarchaeota archaeon]|nr:hypothetical protein [Candidatus Bathyarchaeota archaeon]